MRSRSPERTARSSAMHSTRSSRDAGNTRPFGVPATVCPDRPTRCSSVAMRCGDPIWQTRSTWPMSMPSSSDAVATSTLQGAVLEPCLGVEPALLGQASMMRRHRIVAQALAQVAGQPLGEAPRVHEHERRPVFPDEAGEPLVILLPDLGRHHRFERGARQLDGQIERAAVAFVDDRAIARAAAAFDRRAAGQECGDRFDRRLRRREADALERRCRDLLEPLEGQGEMRAAAGVDDGVNLVDDDRLDGPEHVPAALAGQQQEQRFRRRDQDVRRLPQHGCALGLCRIAGADRDGDAGCGDAGGLGVARDLAARHRQVLVNVRAERLERRHVHHADFVRQRRALAFAEQVVERREKRRERLAGSGRRRDERVAAGPNRLPALFLGRRRCAERFVEPACDYRMKAIHGHGERVRRGRFTFYRSAVRAASADRSLTASSAAWALIVLLKYANTGRPRPISALSQSAQSSRTCVA